MIDSAHTAHATRALATNFQTRGESIPVSVAEGESMRLTITQGTWVALYGSHWTSCTGNVEVAYGP